jgi:hypothetical protein
MDPLADFGSHAARVLRRATMMAEAHGEDRESSPEVCESRCAEVQGPLFDTAPSMDE